MHFAARTLALLLLALPALAQDFPSRPITLICPWPAGGSTDTHLRRFAEIATRALPAYLATRARLLAQLFADEGLKRVEAA